MRKGDEVIKNFVKEHVLIINFEKFSYFIKAEYLNNISLFYYNWHMLDNHDIIYKFKKYCKNNEITGK